MQRIWSLGGLVLIAACTPPAPPPPSSAQSALELSAARERIVTVLRQTGWGQITAGEGSVQATTNDAGLAACEKIIVRSGDDASGRRRFAEPYGQSGEMTVNLSEAAAGTAVQWQTSFAANYRNSFTISTFSADCPSSGLTERALVAALGDDEAQGSETRASP